MRRDGVLRALQIHRLAPRQHIILEHQKIARKKNNRGLGRSEMINETSNEGIRGQEVDGIVNIEISSVYALGRSWAAKYPGCASQIIQRTSIE
jgi:hypothetical protein